MLLRRISEHVKAQNWTAVGLDFVIVVVGVFIGIQVANWNDARSERDLEVRYLERFYFDMVRSIERMDFVMNWSTDRLETQEIVLGALRTKKLTEAEKPDFDRGLAFFGYSAEPARNWETIEELKSSGRMALITDENLRELIGRKQSEYENRSFRALRNRQQRDDNRLLIQDRWQYVGSDFLAGGKTKISYDFEVLTNDTEFLNRLSHMHTTTELIRLDEILNLADFVLLRDAVVDSLGYTPVDQDNDNAGSVE